jgi:hypothetical protein
MAAASMLPTTLSPDPFFLPVRPATGGELVAVVTLGRKANRVVCDRHAH